MVIGKSPEWLPPGFVEKVKHRNGRKIKYYINVAMGVKYYSKKEVIRATEDNDVIVTHQKENDDESITPEKENGDESITPQKENGDESIKPQKENGDENALSIDNKVDVVSIKENGSPAWLPNGWIMEERRRHNRSTKGSVYKVYSELSSGKKFYSKIAVARYLNTLDPTSTMTVQNQVDKDKPSVDEPSTVTSLQLVPMANTGDISNVDNKPNVDAGSIETSLQLVSITNSGGINKTKRKPSSFTTVATERSTDDDLPPGWIKEIKIGKSGNKMRRDPFYTDPVSGYIFRSKKDAMRYLETNDISNCACKPLKRELNDIKLIENEIPPTNPANEELPESKGPHLLDGELNGGEIPSGTKGVAESETKQKQGHFESDNIEVENKILFGKSEKKNAEIINNPAAPETGPSTSSKSKKRKGLTSPSRTSKRLAGRQPEIAPIINLSEHSLRAAARSSVDKSPPNITVDKSSENVPLPSEIEQSEAVPEEAFKGDETHQERLREIVENLFNDAEEPHIDGPDVQPGGEKQIDESKKTDESSQLCYDFGDSWSNPLEFAFKTLMGEISIDHPLTFPSFSEPDSVPQNQAEGGFKQSQSDVPQNEFAESSKQVGPSLSSVSPLGDIGFGSIDMFNCQSSNEVGKKDFLTKFNP